MSTTIHASAERALCTALLEAAGMRQDDAVICADAFTWADLRGITPQGIAKLPLCIARLESGGNTAAPSVDVVAHRGSVEVLDGDLAWGQVAAVRGMRRAIAAARDSGVGVSVVRNTCSASAMGYYAWLGAEAGMIGLAINNSLALMPPWGGTGKVLGNHAFALGCPAGRHLPMIFDAATSGISWTGIERHLERGEMLPPGVALDSNGLPTTDPRAALAGTLLPFGQHRGSGLTVMWEVLTGVLSGAARFGPDITPIGTVDTPQGVSQFLLALDPTVSMPLDEFTARVDRFVDHLHASIPQPGVDRVYAPGERSGLVALQRERDGIPISAQLRAELQALASRMKVQVAF